VARKLILCSVLALGLLLPETGLAVPTKQVNKKSTSLKGKKSNTESTRATKSTKSTSKKTVRSAAKKKRTYSTSRRRATPTPSYQPYTAGIGETKPLMKVIPQRDGRFLLEPLTPKTPKDKLGPLSGPTSRLDDKDKVVPGRGYNLYEPWNFRELVLAMAKGYQGTPYSMGGSLSYGNATDCSGFVQYIYQGFQINLPRSSREQAHVGKVVTHNMDFSKLVPGDLLFFSRRGYRVGHAGIYLGEGKMIHASSRGRGVTITDLRENYYQNTFVVAKRVFEVTYLK
jgi:cell wall-associated NlpC family hydrolase